MTLNVLFLHSFQYGVMEQECGHTSSLCLHAAVFTHSGIRLNKHPLNTCRWFYSKVIEVWCWAQARPMPRKCGTLGGMLTNAETLLPPLFFIHCSKCLPLLCIHSCTLHTHTDSIQAAIHVPHTSLSGTCNAHKDLFIASLNARCHIRGSGAGTSLTEREKRTLCNTWGHNLFVLVSQRGGS